MTSQSDAPDELPEPFFVAVDQFNGGEFYACHETLETIWIPETRPIREVYQGVIQIAVGCYHLTVRNNWVGAVNKLEAGARRLDAAHAIRERERYGIDWTGLIRAAGRLRDHLDTLGRDRVREYDPNLIPRIVHLGDNGSTS